MLAIAEFERALAINPRDSDAVINRMKCKFAVGDRNEVLNEVQRLIIENPTIGTGYICQSLFLVSPQGLKDAIIFEKTKAISDLRVIQLFVRKRLVVPREISLVQSRHFRS